MKALKCDRCGAFYDLLTLGEDKYEVIKFQNHQRFDVDLCPNCRSALNMFMKHPERVLIKEENNA